MTLSVAKNTFGYQEHFRSSTTLSVIDSTFGDPTLVGEASRDRRRFRLPRILSVIDSTFGDPTLVGKRVGIDDTFGYQEHFRLPGTLSVIDGTLGDP
jgi:hypothetical protein